MADAATELTRGLVESITPGGSDIFKGFGGLLDMILGGATPKSTKTAPPINQRLPRIVPDGKGGFIDLNTNKPVGKVADGSDSNINKLIRAAQAQKELERQGSVMARGEEPQWKKDNPLMASVLDTIMPLLQGGFDPTNISGPSQAVLGPIGKTASVSMNRVQKQLAKALFRGDPGMAELARSSPKMIQLSAPGAGMPAGAARRLAPDIDPTGILGESFGVHSTVNPALSQVKINPKTLKGRAPTGDIYGSREAGNLPDLVSTVLHEVTHGFGGPLTRQAQPATLQNLLNTTLPQLPDVFRKAVLSEPTAAKRANEAVSYLSEAALRSPEGSSQRNLWEGLKSLFPQAVEGDIASYISQRAGGGQ